MVFVTKTRLYDFDPLQPLFYVVKLGFTGVYFIFLILLKHTDCGYLLEPPHQGVLMSTHNLCFEQKYEKYQNFLSENFSFLGCKLSIYLNRRVYVMYYVIVCYLSLFASVLLDGRVCVIVPFPGYRHL